MSRRRFRPVLAALVAAAALGLGAVGADAHVSVLPAQVRQGDAQELTIRVPNEGALATTRVEVEFPPQVTVYAFAQPPGDWTVTPRRAADGTFRGVTYSGGRIPPDGYADFTVLATPFETGTAVFPTRQTYGANRVKPWTGPPEKPGEESAETGPTAPGPAPAIEVIAAGAATPIAPGRASGDQPTITPAPAAPASDDGSGAAIWIGVIAILIAALALGAVGLVWSTRPARLPSDDD